MKKAAASPEVFNFSNRVDHARPKKKKKKKIYVHTYISFTARRQGKGFPRQESASQISFWIPKNPKFLDSKEFQITNRKEADDIPPGRHFQKHL